MIAVRDVEKKLFDWAPLELAVSWDNVGHLVGEPEAEVKKVLVALDITEAVVQEVICNAVYEQAESMDLLMDTITDSGLVPLPDSYYLTGDALRVLYDTDTLHTQALALDLLW